MLLLRAALKTPMSTSDACDWSYPFIFRRLLATWCGETEWSSWQLSVGDEFSSEEIKSQFHALLYGYVWKSICRLVNGSSSNQLDSGFRSASQHIVSDVYWSNQSEKRSSQSQTHILNTSTDYSFSAAALNIFFQPEPFSHRLHFPLFLRSALTSSVTASNSASSTCFTTTAKQEILSWNSMIIKQNKKIKSQINFPKTTRWDEPSYFTKMHSQTSCTNLHRLKYSM